VSAAEEQAASLLAGQVDFGLVGPLAAYAALVIEANANFNLTGAKTVPEFVPHLLDSLTVVPYAAAPYIDIGSGAGLPGIPVALASGVETTLLEATQKKAKFLSDTVEALSLDAPVIAARAEDSGRDPRWREHFQSATIRAVSSAPAALELAAPFLEIGGVAILQRGAAEPGEAEALSLAAQELGCFVESEVGLEGGRRLLLVRRTEATPDAFPRRPGTAQKRPLGR
jgi:16S rRNA (guanine527-N7)-methyltransferase